MQKNIFLRLITVITLMILSLISSFKAYSQTFTLPSCGDDIVGKVQWTQSLPGDNFSKLGRRYDVGYYQLVEANPGVDPHLPNPGTVVVIPTQYIIPHVPHVGIVLNLAELRVYYFPPGTNKLITYPVGIGREGWNTPLGVTTIVAKVVNPTWVPTENIRKWRASQGVNLPAKIEPGPDNPLGGYALHLGFPTIRMHGTNDPSGIGRRSSSGCIRMWPEDIEEIFSLIKTHTAVHVINDPYKAGWLKNKVYLESHIPLEEQQDIYEKDLSPMAFDIEAMTANRPAEINWDKAKNIAETQNGIAQVVGEAKI